MPCIVFPVTTVKLRHGQDQETVHAYKVKADGLHDLLITTEDKLVPFSPAMPTRQTILLVRPWDRNLLELSDSEDNKVFSVPRTTGDIGPVHSESQSRASRLIDRLRQPFGAVANSLSVRGEVQGAVGSESYARALRLVVHLEQPFCALLLAQQRSGEYKRIASDRDIVAQVNDITSVRHIVESVRTLEIL
jgi:hypothetical protein